MKDRRELLPSRVFKYSKGMYIKKIILQTILETKIEIPDRENFIHLQFRRFAGCPVCNLHLQSFARRQQQLTNARIREVIVFHSTREELLKYTSGFPFDLVADPKKQLYKNYGVESSLWAIADPLAFISIIIGIANSTWEFLLGKRPLPSFAPGGGSLGLPADFLIAPDGKIIDCHYGRHADDQWSVEELIQIAAVAKQTRNKKLFNQLR
jgi:peroxiredoxin